MLHVHVNQTGDAKTSTTASTLLDVSIGSFQLNRKRKKIVTERNGFKMRAAHEQVEPKDSFVFTQKFTINTMNRKSAVSAKHQKHSAPAKSPQTTHK